jgi:hypothetical protein
MISDVSRIFLSWFFYTLKSQNPFGSWFSIPICTVIPLIEFGGSFESAARCLMHPGRDIPQNAINEESCAHSKRTTTSRSCCFFFGSLLYFISYFIIRLLGIHVKQIIAKNYLFLSNVCGNHTDVLTNTPIFINSSCSRPILDELYLLYLLI